MRLIKSSARSVVGQPGHAGDRRGNPDFCPPNLSGTKRSGGQVAVPPIEEESDDDDEDVQQQHQAKLSPVPVTHAALPLAIAAACRAGEELERRRMSRSTEVNQSDMLPMVQLSPRLRRHSSDGMLHEGKVHYLPERRMSLVNSAVQSLILQDENNSHHEVISTNKAQPVHNKYDETNQNGNSNASSLPPPPFTASEATATSNLEASTQSALPDSSKKKSRRALQFTLKSPFDETDEHPFHFHGPRSVRHWINKRRHHSSDNLRSYVKGKVIDRQHELFIMSIAIMLGMRTSIGRTNMQMAETEHDERRWLDNDDLMSVEKYIFPPKGSEITPPHQLNHTFKFKDYSPHAFAYLRRMFGVNEYEFLLSVCGNANYIEFQVSTHFKIQ